MAQSKFKPRSDVIYQDESIKILGSRCRWLIEDFDSSQRWLNDFSVSQFFNSVPGVGWEYGLSEMAVHFRAPWTHSFMQRHKHGEYIITKNLRGRHRENSSQTTTLAGLNQRPWSCEAVNVPPCHLSPVQNKNNKEET